MEIKQRIDIDKVIGRLTAYKQEMLDCDKFCEEKDIVNFAGVAEGLDECIELLEQVLKED